MSNALLDLVGLDHAHTRSAWHKEHIRRPRLQRLDDLISQLERMIWECAWERRGNGEHEDAVHARICDPNYTDPLALGRTILLAERNTLARSCGVKQRAAHDLGPDALGY